MKRLSAAQRKAVLALTQHPKECSYRLRVGLNTLEALEKRGLVLCYNHGELGSGWSPRTILKYGLTTLGEQAAKQLRKEAPCPKR